MRGVFSCMASLLIIDDDAIFCDMLSAQFAKLKYFAEFVNSADEGIARALLKDFDVIILDTSVVDGNSLGSSTLDSSGLSVIRSLKQTKSAPDVIVLSKDFNPAEAEMVFKHGAWDYCQKDQPFSYLYDVLKSALKKRQQSDKVISPIKLDGLVATSPAMKLCIELVKQTTRTDVNVLIVGETGTGKERIAKSIHNNSPRAKGHFIIVDCAAMPETLIESILLGHEKGAFTGAHCARDGLIKQADGGTLFLDEIAELSLHAQKALLRVLQEKQFRPVGCSRELTSDFRIIAATNRNLSELVQKGSFREDLLYRLKSTTIELPPLRDRGIDIEHIAHFMIEQRCKQWNLDVKIASDEYLTTLKQHKWPGNVRELIHAIDHSISCAINEQTLYPQHLPTDIRIHLVQTSLSSNLERDGDSDNSENVTHRRFGLVGRTTLVMKIPDKGASEISEQFPNLQNWRENALADAEKKYLCNLMAHTKGNIKTACLVAQISRSRLYALLSRYGIERSAQVAC